MAKMMSPNMTIWWVDANATFNPKVPTAAALIADLAGTPKAWNISSAIENGFTLNPTDSDTDDSSVITDEANAEGRGIGNYEASLTFFREKDPVANPLSTFLKAYTLFKTRGRAGALVQRAGWKSTVAPAATQPVNIFVVKSSQPRNVVGDKGSPIRFTVPFRQQGYFMTNTPLG